jgi:hypothetical protein
MSKYVDMEAEVKNARRIRQLAQVVVDAWSHGRTDMRFHESMSKLKAALDASRVYERRWGGVVAEQAKEA